jgi:site-specific DNA-methyltransferase (adenine-specific)
MGEDSRERPIPRNRNHHPTVKPVDLMRWLVRLVCPPGGTVIDPFTGSGTTGVACRLEGFGFIGIDIEPAYIDMARQRIAAETPSLFTQEAV